MSAPLRKAFSGATTDKPKKIYPKPVSVRFTDSERTELERKAGDLTLSAYIRSRCVAETSPAHRTRGKRPVKDYEALSRVLGALGRSNLSNNINQIAKATHTEAIGFPDDMQDALKQAAFDIAYIRMTLIKALGLTDGDT